MTFQLASSFQAVTFKAGIQITQIDYFAPNRSQYSGRPYGSHRQHHPGHVHPLEWVCIVQMVLTSLTALGFKDHLTLNHFLSRLQPHDLISSGNFLLDGVFKTEQQDIRMGCKSWLLQSVEQQCLDTACYT